MQRARKSEWNKHLRVLFVSILLRHPVPLNAVRGRHATTAASCWKMCAKMEWKRLLYGKKYTVVMNINCNLQVVSLFNCFHRRADKQRQTHWKRLSRVVNAVYLSSLRARMVAFCAAESLNSSIRAGKTAAYERVNRLYTFIFVWLVVYLFIHSAWPTFSLNKQPWWIDFWWTLSELHRRSGILMGLSFWLHFKYGPASDAAIIDSVNGRAENFWSISMCRMPSAKWSVTALFRSQQFMLRNYCRTTFCFLLMRESRRW